MLLLHVRSARVSRSVHPAVYACWHASPFTRVHARLTADSFLIGKKRASGKWGFAINIFLFSWISFLSYSTVELRLFELWTCRGIAVYRYVVIEVHIIEVRSFSTVFLIFWSQNRSSHLDNWVQSTIVQLIGHWLFRSNKWNFTVRVILILFYE